MGSFSPSRRIALNVSTADPADGSSREPLYFDGWHVVVMTFVVQFVSVGVGYYTFGVFLVPLTEELDVSRTLVAVTSSAQMIFMAVLGPWVGKLLAEGSVRNYMLLGVVLMVVGLVITSQATALWHLYLGFGLILSPGLVLTGILPNNLLLANWFNRRRGTAMGISQFGVSLSGTALVPLTAWIVVTYDWRTAFLVFAVATPIVLIPLILAFAVKTPEERGLYPDGDAEPPPPEPEGEVEEWTFARAARVRDVWLLALIVGPSFMGVAAVVLVLHSHATDLGFSAGQASIMVAVTTFFGAVAKPLFGTLADYLNKRLVVAISLTLQFIGVVFLIFTTSYYVMLGAMVLFGLGYGATAPMWSVLLADRFGRASFARVMGAVMPLTMPFNLFALPATTLAFDFFGSYVPAFTALLGFYVLAASCLAILRLPSEAPPPHEIPAPDDIEAARTTEASSAS